MYIHTIQGSGNKKILILGGVHGDEISPVYILHKLIEDNKIDTTKFKELKIINAINTSGIKANTRDMQFLCTNDLNRKLSIEHEQDITNLLENDIKQFDVIIDIHSSPDCTEFLLLNQDEYTNSYVEFSIKNDIPYLIRFSATNTIKKYALDLCKISFTLEVNKMSVIDFESSNKAIQLIFKLINDIDSFDNTKSRPINKPYKEWTFYKEGIFIPEQKIGDVVNVIKGDLLDICSGEITTITEFLDGNYKIICSGNRSFLTPNGSFYFLQQV